MENSTSWYAVVIIGSDFMALFLFCSFTLESLIFPPPCYSSSSSPPYQKKSFIVLAILQYFHYHLPPHPLSITWLETDVRVISRSQRKLDKPPEYHSFSSSWCLVQQHHVTDNFFHPSHNSTA